MSWICGNFVSLGKMLSQTNMASRAAMLGNSDVVVKITTAVECVVDVSGAVGWGKV